MSVVAGCSLFNGILLISDCRVTIPRGSENIYVDNIQKLFPLTATTAIGFVGDINIASKIIQNLGIQIQSKVDKGKGRVDPISLRGWLPRYIHHLYEQNTKDGLQKPSIAFMVASVIRERPNEVERTKIIKIMERRLSKQQNWLPDIFADILPSLSNEVITLPNTPLGFLYFMKSPEFIRRDVKPLEFCVLGSGEEARIYIDEVIDLIFSGYTSNSSMESMLLREIVSSYINEHNIESVGGLYPGLKIDFSGIHPIPYISEIPAGEAKIELSFGSDQRWVQKNLTSGKEINLLYPWEIDVSKYSDNQKFDDLNDAKNVM